MAEASPTGALTPELVVTITPRRGRGLGLQELWAHRTILYFLAWRDVKVRYKQTVLGASWAVLQPLLMMLVFTVVFSRGLGVQAGGSTPYPVFVLSGLIVWNLFGSGVLLAANSTVANAAMLSKIYFPRLLIPISAVGVTLFDFAITLVPFAGVLLYYRVSPRPDMLMLLPIAVVIAVLTTVGLGCLLAALNTKYRDFRYVVPFGVQLGLFVTPVIYPSSILPEGPLSTLMTLNPLKAPIDLVRHGLAGSARLDPTELAASAVVSLILFVGGLLYFRRVEWEFADVA